jgi:nitrogen regulatory protein PII
MDVKPIKLVVIIADRAKGKKLSGELNGHGYGLHYGFLGTGTAPSEISAYFGGESEKAVITMLCAEEEVRSVFRLLYDKLHIGKPGGGGIAFSVPVNCASNIQVVKFILGLNKGEEKKEL